MRLSAGFVFLMRWQYEFVCHQGVGYVQQYRHVTVMITEPDTYRQGSTPRRAMMFEGLSQVEIQATQKTGLDCLLCLSQACGVIHECNKRHATVMMVMIGEETHITQCGGVVIFDGASVIDEVL